MQEAALRHEGVAMAVPDDSGSSADARSSGSDAEEAGAVSVLPLVSNGATAEADLQDSASHLDPDR